MNNIILFGLQLNSTFSCLFRGIAAEKGNEVKGNNIDYYHVEDIKALVFRRVTPSTPKRVNGAIIMKVQQKTVKNTAAGGYDHATFAVENDTGIYDSEYIEEREYTIYTTSCIYYARYYKCVRQELAIG